LSPFLANHHGYRLVYAPHPSVDPSVDLLLGDDDAVELGDAIDDACTLRVTRALRTRPGSDEWRRTLPRAARCAAASPSRARRPPSAGPPAPRSSPERPAPAGDRLSPRRWSATIARHAPGTARGGHH